VRHRSEAATALLSMAGFVGAPRCSSTASCAPTWETTADVGRLHPRGPYVEISPADADRFGVVAGQDVVVTSARGSMQARAVVTPTVRPGQLFAPMHDPQVNGLTFPSFDPSSRQPSYKHCAVAVRPRRHWE
jgi:anaerobic selenocysteine-containing dehydrogenase